MPTTALPPLACIWVSAGDQCTAGIHQSTWSTPVKFISPSYQLRKKNERVAASVLASDAGSLGSMPYFASMPAAKPSAKFLPVYFWTAGLQNASALPMKAAICACRPE